MSTISNAKCTIGLTIVIPFYNNPTQASSLADHLVFLFNKRNAPTIDSLEILLVDDCSHIHHASRPIPVDTTLQNVSISMSRTLVNLGPVGAKAYGISNAIYPYVLIFDSDDWPNPNIFNAITTTLRDYPYVPILSFSVESLQGNQQYIYPPSGFVTVNALLSNFKNKELTYLFNTDKLPPVIFRPGFRVCEGYSILTLLGSGFTMLFLDLPIRRYDANSPSSVSLAIHTDYRNLFDLIRYHRLILSLFPVHRSVPVSLRSLFALIRALFLFSISYVRP